jgi:archaemetzincin
LDKPRILFISFGQFDHDFLEKIAAAVNTEFGLAVDVDINHSDLNEYYDPARRQYDGNKLIKYIHSGYSAGKVKAIGLFRVDLFIPILTYVIGQAVFGGNAGVVSLYRLKNELYGLKRDENLLFERFRKEVFHELGHIFGLPHCLSPVCVMRSSTYVEDVDEKKPRFCIRCREKLEIKKKEFTIFP